MPAGPVILSLAEFKARSVIPSDQVDALEANRPGFTAKRISAWSRWIEARLRKRYVVPFPGDVPEIVLVWLVALVTRDVYAALGTTMLSDEERKSVADAAEGALTDLKEAADEENGLFDLPVRDDQDNSDLTEEAPIASADTSPYEWIDRQGSNGEFP